jgi:hypothetical protein
MGNVDDIAANLAARVAGSSRKALNNVGLDLPQQEVTRIVSALLDASVEFSKPVYEEVADDTGLVTLYPEKPNEVLGASVMRGGISVKPGNVILDSGKLIRFIRSLAKSAIDAISAPISIPIVILELWDALSSMLGVELTTDDAAVLWGMLLACDEHQIVDERDWVARVNRELEANGGEQLEESSIIRST